MSLVAVPGGAGDVVLRSGQDVKDFEQVADLFGVSIESAGRYVDTLEHPDLAAAGTQVRGTSTPT
jgi:hypothetical protein